MSSKKLIPSQERRRENLLEHMHGLDGKDVSCRECEGVCCTFVSNSMQITPLEAYDLFQFLSIEGRWTKSLKEQLERNIRVYALDRPPLGDGVRVFSRRRYTCPFFGDERLGCSIDPLYKPYGCLGFNPLITGIKEGEKCQSQIELLKQREDIYPSELEENKEICVRFKLGWEKKSIPEALLCFEEAYPFK